MNKETTLFSLASDIEYSSIALEELAALIDILDNEIEEGYQREGAIETWKAIHYVSRIPRRLALLRTIQRELNLQIKELITARDQLMEMHKATKSPSCATPPT